MFLLGRLPIVFSILLVLHKVWEGLSAVYLLSDASSSETFCTNCRKSFKSPRKARTSVCVVGPCSMQDVFVVVSAIPNNLGSVSRINQLTVSAKKGFLIEALPRRFAVASVPVGDGLDAPAQFSKRGPC